MAKRGRKPLLSTTALAKWMKREGIEPIDIAQQIRFGVNAINRARAGDGTPSLLLAIALERLSDGEVPVESWLPDWSPKALKRRVAARRRRQEPERAESPGEPALDLGERLAAS